MLSKNHPIVLFIDRSGFSVFQDTQPNIAKFNFTPDLVANLDVINKEKFLNLIASFIQINKIVPSSLAVLLSDAAIFVKDLAQPHPNSVSVNGVNKELGQDHKEEIQNFLENVPFEEVLAKVIKTGGASHIVAVNKDLVMAIAGVFADKGSVVDAIIPAFVFGSKANFTSGLNQDDIKVVLRSAEIIKEGNLLTDRQEVALSQNLEIEQKNQPAGEEKKPQNLRQYLLIGVFIILLVISVFLYLNLSGAQTASQNPKGKNPSAGTENAPIIPSAGRITPSQIPITTAVVDLKSIKIKISHGSQADEKVASLKNELLKVGFQDIASEISDVSIPEKSSVIFSQNIQANVRGNTILEIKKILPDVSVLENQDTDLIITIILGKS